MAAAVAAYDRYHPVPLPLIGPADAPVNIVGGHRFPGAPQIDLTAETVPAQPDTASALIATIPADLSIPGFLRHPLPAKEATP
jgi:hypothetical protein